MAACCVRSSRAIGFASTRAEAKFKLIEVAGAVITERCAKNSAGAGIPGHAAAIAEPRENFVRRVAGRGTDSCSKGCEPMKHILPLPDLSFRHFRFSAADEPQPVDVAAASTAASKPERPPIRPICSATISMPAKNSVRVSRNSPRSKRRSPARLKRPDDQSLDQSLASQKHRSRRG